MPEVADPIQAARDRLVIQAARERLSGGGPADYLPPDPRFKDTLAPGSMTQEAIDAPKREIRETAEKSENDQIVAEARRISGGHSALPVDDPNVAREIVRQHQIRVAKKAEEAGPWGNLDRALVMGATGNQVDPRKAHTPEMREALEHREQNAGFGEKLAVGASGLAGALAPLGVLGKVGTVARLGRAAGPAALAAYGAVSAEPGHKIQGAIEGAAFGAAAGALGHVASGWLARLPAVQQSAVLQKVASMGGEAAAMSAAGQAVSLGAGRGLSAEQALHDFFLGAGLSGMGGARSVGALVEARRSPTPEIRPEPSAGEVPGSTERRAAAREGDQKAYDDAYHEELRLSGVEPGAKPTPEQKARAIRKGLDAKDKYRATLDPKDMEAPPARPLEPGERPTTGDTSAWDAGTAGEPWSGVGHRGVGPGRTVEESGHEGARFFSSEKRIARGYADETLLPKGGFGEVKSENLDFKNAVVAKHRDEASWKLGFPEGGATWTELIAAARKRGHDGIVLKSNEGAAEYVDLRGPTPLAEKVPGYGAVEAHAAEVKAQRAAEAPPARIEPPVAEGEGPVTSIKNRVVNEERAARGVDPLPEEAPQSRQGWMDQAKKIVAENPNEPRRIIEDVTTKPRDLKPVESAVLNVHKVNLNKEVAKYDAEGIAARERGDLDAAAEHAARAAAVRAEFDAVDIATKTGGREWGRGGVARQMEIAADYSLLAMERQRRAGNAYDPLTPKQAAETKALHERIAKAEAERDAYRTRLADVEAKRDIGEVVRPRSRTAPGHAEYGKANKVVTRESYAKALAEFKGITLSAGIDPSKLAAAVKIGAYHLEAGVRGFASWAKAMTADLGESVTPHLRAVWNAAQGQLSEKTIGDVKAKVKEGIEGGKDIHGMPGEVGKLAELFVRQGVTERGKLVDAVHEVLAAVDPRITKRDTMDAISGYGKQKKLDADPAKVELRELKGQMLQIAKLEDMAAGKPPAKTGLEHQSPQEAQRELIKLVNDAKRLGGFTPAADPAVALRALKTRLTNRIKDLEKRTAANDFAARERKPLARDAEAVKLEASVEVAKKAWNEALMRDKLANRSLVEKAAMIPVEAANTVRAVMTSFDFSAVLRQGGFVALGHPIRAAKAMGAMFRAFVSKGGQARAEAELTLRPNYSLAKRSGLFLAEHGPTTLSKMEEAYMSRWAEKIPGVAASQRAYTTFLNRLRMDSFDAMVGNLSRGATPTPKESAAIASFVNTATGRGGGKDSAGLAALSTVFFSPRLVVSRLQILAGQPMYRGTARTRLMVAKEYARFLTGIGVVYGLGKLAGAEVETDPRSSDFGKMRFGETRLDPMAGLAQVTTLVSRLATGETKSIGGKVSALRGDDMKYGRDDSADVIARFLRTKLAPVVGAGVDLVSGKDVIGRKVTLGSEAANLATPMAFRDIYGAMKANGVPAGTALGILSLFGMGLQTHDDKKPRK